VQAAFAKFDTRAVGNSPAEFSCLIAEELKKWKAIAAEFNITVD